MKTIGRRHEPPLHVNASGTALAEGARFSESLHHFSPAVFIPKGVYRFKTHEEANKHWQDCLAASMAKLAEQRR
jgi:hypothetical protein